MIGKRDRRRQAVGPFAYPSDAETLMTDALAGRSVLVTGGSMGIGFACAAAVLAAGGRVVIAARGEAALAEAEQHLAATTDPERVAAFPCDVADEAAVARLLQ